MNKKRTAWIKPILQSINNQKVEKNIVVSACSRYSGCFPGGGHIESIPGKPPVELM